MVLIRRALETVTAVCAVLAAVVWRSELVAIIWSGAAVVSLGLPAAALEHEWRTPASSDHLRSAQNRDSIYALNVAKNALKVHHFRFREFGADISPASFICERSVYPYCFGPTNGRILHNDPRHAMSVELRTSHETVPRFFQKRIDRLVTDLMRALETAQKKIPGDRWVIGQRVFHLIQHGEFERALTVATSCASEKWWCASLVGYASQMNMKHHAADSAFTVALESLSAAERCRWEGVEDLVADDGDRKWYSELTCEEREEANRTLWWLADPLFLTPGNERRSDHFYREVFRQLFLDSNNSLPQYVGSSFTKPPPGFGTAYNRALANNPTRVAGMVYERELWNQGALSPLLRSLGVPTALMIEEPPRIPTRSGRWLPDPTFVPQFLLQFKQPTYHFVPNLAAVQNPLSARVDDWNILDPKSAERYHPHFGTFVGLDHQIAWFRRGDSSRVVVATNPDGAVSTRVDSQLVTSAVILSRNPDDIRIFRSRIPGTNATFDLLVPAESALVSVEAMTAGVGAARTRFASGPAMMAGQRVMISDLLIMRQAGSPDIRLEEAATLASPSTSISANSTIPLFWEVYGLSSGDSVTYSLSVQRDGSSIAASIARFVGIQRQAPQSGIVWREQISATEGVGARSITIDIAALDTGRYTARLDVMVSGQTTATTLREFEVR